MAAVVVQSWDPLLPPQEVEAGKDENTPSSKLSVVLRPVSSGCVPLHLVSSPSSQVPSPENLEVRLRCIFFFF